MATYQVLVRCDDYCEHHEPERVLIETESAEYAIERSMMVEDKLHHTRIIIKDGFAEGPGYK